MGQLGRTLPASASNPTWSHTPGVAWIPTKGDGWVTALACGRDHSLVCCGDAVYGCGRNSFGTLGSGTTDHAKRFIEVSFLQGRGIAMLAAGVEHSAAVSHHGELFCWGQNSSGQCGIGERHVANDVHLAPFPVPFEVDGPGRIVALAAGSHHTAVAWQGAGGGEHHTLVWGVNRHGQLGLGSNAHTGSAPHSRISWTPTRAELFQGCRFSVASLGKWHCTVHKERSPHGLLDMAVAVLVTMFGFLPAVVSEEIVAAMAPHHGYAAQP